MADSDSDGRHPADLEAGGDPAPRHRRAGHKGFQLAKQVDSPGWAIVLTTTLEHAELERDQIRSFDADRVLAHSKGSMTAAIEAEPARASGDAKRVSAGHDRGFFTGKRDVLLASCRRHVTRPWLNLPGRVREPLVRGHHRDMISEDELLGSSALSEAPAERRPTWMNDMCRFPRTLGPCAGSLRRFPAPKCTSAHLGCMHAAKTSVFEESVMRAAWIWPPVIAVILPWATAFRMAATDIEECDFNASDSGWTSGVGQWEWTEQGGNEKSWKLLLSGSNPSADSQGVVPGASVPDPGTLALAAIGGVAFVALRPRREPWARKLGCSAFTGITLSLLAIACALAVPPPVKADVLFDFRINQNGNVPGVTWTESQQGKVPLAKRWTYSSTGDNRWGVLASGADSITSGKAAHLTSGTFSGIVDSLPAQNARISLAHNFFLPPSGTGGPRPITLGELQYQINNSGTWVGLPLSAYTSDGSVNTDDPVFGPSPFKNPIDPLDPFFVDQTAFVAPTYVTPTTAPLIPYVAPGGAAFVGLTDGWSSLYVPSQAFLNIDTGLPEEGITSLRLRLSNASIGGNCVSGEGWNVRMLSVEFDSVRPPVPEPGTLALTEPGTLALTGVGAACAARARRRRRSPAALEAE